MIGRHTSPRWLRPLLFAVGLLAGAVAVLPVLAWLHGSTQARHGAAWEAVRR